MRIASTTAAAPPSNATAVASRANDAGSDEITTPCQNTLSDPSPSAAAKTPTTIAAHVRSDRSPRSSAAAARTASSAADPTSSHCARLAPTSPVANAVLAASAPAAATPATAAAVSARRRGTAWAKAASAPSATSPATSQGHSDGRATRVNVPASSVRRPSSAIGSDQRARAPGRRPAGGDSRWSCQSRRGFAFRRAAARPGTARQARTHMDSAARRTRTSSCGTRSGDMSPHVGRDQSRRRLVRDMSPDLVPTTARATAVPAARTARRAAAPNDGTP